MADTPTALTLAVKKGRCVGETRQCRAGAVLRVGRVVKGNDLAVRDVGASQRHFSIEFLPPPAARWAVSDLGSSNGTLLNGVPLVHTVPSPLSDGDLIKIGESTVLEVSIASDSVVEQEQPTALTRRGRRKKPVAAVEEPPEAVEKEPEEAAVVTRRGARKKAPDPAQAVEHDKGKDGEEQAEIAVVTRRGGRRKAAPEAALPPPPPTTRSTRAAARRDKAVDPVLDEATEAALPVARRGRARRGGASGSKGRANAHPHRATSGNEGGGEEEDGKVEERAGRSSLETMTLREWFERMSVYLPRMIHEAAEEALEAVRERHRLIDEYISTLED